jgi:hypothetical protein
MLCAMIELPWVRWWLDPHRCLPIDAERSGLPVVHLLSELRPPDDGTKKRPDDISKDLAIEPGEDSGVPYQKELELYGGKSERRAVPHGAI